MKHCNIFLKISNIGIKRNYIGFRGEVLANRIKRIVNRIMVSFFTIVLKQFNLHQKKMKKTTYMNFELRRQRTKLFKGQTFIHLPKGRDEII
jgi:hypothetical protein